MRRAPGAHGAPSETMSMERDTSDSVGLKHQESLSHLLAELFHHLSPMLFGRSWSINIVPKLTWNDDKS